MNLQKTFTDLHIVLAIIQASETKKVSEKNVASKLAEFKPDRLHCGNIE